MSKKKAKPARPRAHDFDFEFDNSETWIDGDKQSQFRPSAEAFVQRTRAIRFGISVSPPSSPSPSPLPPEVEEPASISTSFTSGWLKSQRQPSAPPKAASSRPTPTAGPAINRSAGESSRAYQSFAGPSSHRARRPHSNAPDDDGFDDREYRSSPVPSSLPEFDIEPGLQPGEFHHNEELERGGSKWPAHQLSGTYSFEYYGSDVDDAYPQSEDIQHHFAPTYPIIQPDLEDDESGLMKPEGFYCLNEAEIAERLGSPRDSTFLVPMIRHQDFLEMFFGTRSSNIQHIAAKTSTYLSVSENFEEEPVIEMWGNPSQIAQAKRDLQALAEHLHRLLEGNRKKTGGKWAKVETAPTEYKALKLLNRARTEARKKKFRHMPEEGAWFDAVGVFIWPNNDPKTLLGTNFQFLDEIRYDCEVYILYSSRKQMFRVLGDNKENVVQALDRIHAVYCEIATRNRKPTKVCLAEPPRNLSGTSVEVRKRHDLIGKNIHVKAYERNTGVMVYLAGPKPSDGFRRLWGAKFETLLKANDSYMRKIMQQALRDAYYTRAYCNLKIYFGQMVLFGYKEPKNGVYGLQEFCDMLRDPQAEAEVIRSIGEDVAKELIEECNNRSEIFHPVDAVPALFEDPYQYGYEPSDDDDDGNGEISVKIEPAICATLDIKLYNDKGETNDLRLEVKFERIPGKHPEDISNDAGELYRAGMRRWIKLHAPNVAPSTSYDRKRTGNPAPPPEGFSRRKGPADIKVADLENDVAWQMELVSYSILKDVDMHPVFSEFERRLRIEEIADECDGERPPLGHPDTRRRIKRVSYANLPGLEVQAVTMKTKWSYWINRTPYVFEVTKYEYLSGEMVRERYPHGVAVSFKGLKVPTDTRWGAALWNDEWKIALSQQVGLRAGVTAKWDCDLASFFKSSGVRGWEWRGKQEQREAERMTRMRDEDEEMLEVDPWDGDGWKECMERIREVARMIKSAKKRTKKKNRGSEPARGQAEIAWEGLAEFDV